MRKERNPWPPVLPELRITSPVGLWLRRYLLILTVLVLSLFAVAGKVAMEKTGIDFESLAATPNFEVPPSP